MTFKDEIRRSMRRLNAGLPAECRAAASKAIFEAVERLPRFRTARTVALFAALPDEPDTQLALARWSVRRRVVLPRVEGDAMEFYDYRPGCLAPGAFGIAEPQPDTICAASEIDVAICPGAAFTADGRRLGRGRGYYDRYLSRPDFGGFRVGVCYAHQLVEELPAEPHDVRMDAVVSH